MWCLPEAANAEFVCAMEDVLDVYERPYDRTRPQICVDETSKQLVGEVRAPQPARRGTPRLFDHEYKRNGVANLFMIVEPLTGACRVKITDQRTRADWAWLMQELVDVHYPQAQTIVLVTDNLNTHDKASLYAAFAPAEAKRIADRLEIHYTPRHGSWLDMAELQLSVLCRQCLNRRIKDRPTLQREVEAWLRHHQAKPIDWQFTTEKARVKLKKLYPSFQE